MKAFFLGVRGSTQAIGPDFWKYGGHTSCVAIAGESGVPALVLDAGTGIRDLGHLLAGKAFTGDIVLGHLHWDHTQGLPFCPAVDRGDAQVVLHVPVRAGEAAVATLSWGMSPPHFPIDVFGLDGSWTVLPVTPGPAVLSGGGAAVEARVEAAEIVHKGGVTHGLRVTVDGSTLVYMSDHVVVPGRAVDAAALELARGADVLIHDGQFTPSEAAIAEAYGHATIDAVCDFADQAEVDRLVLTHHAPSRTDAQLDELARQWTRTPQGRCVTFAHQGMVLDV